MLSKVKRTHRLLEKSAAQQKREIFDGKIGAILLLFLLSFHDILTRPITMKPDKSKRN